MWGLLPAVAGYAALRSAYLAGLTPEKRRDFLAKEGARREAEALDAEPEVQAAKALIADDDLQGEHAERLVAFARDLARRRSL